MPSQHPAHWLGCHPSYWKRVLDGDVGPAARKLRPDLIRHIAIHPKMTPEELRWNTFFPANEIQLVRFYRSFHAGLNLAKGDFPAK
jgi:hypothetical protein